MSDEHSEDLDPEIEQRIDGPVSAEAVRETRLTPAEAIAGMRIRLPERGNRKLRRVLDRANNDPQLKAWWHVSNVNAVARMQINDHSWVHIQVVVNIALKLLRQLTKHHVEPSVVRDYGLTNEDAEVVVVLSALMHCVGMSVHRRGHEDFSLFLSEPKMRELLDGIYDEPERTRDHLRGAAGDHEPPLRRRAARARGRHPPRRRCARHGQGPLANSVRGGLGVDALAVGRSDRRGDDRGR